MIFEAGVCAGSELINAVSGAPLAVAAITDAQEYLHQLEKVCIYLLHAINHDTR